MQLTCPYTPDDATYRATRRRDHLSRLPALPPSPRPSPDWVIVSSNHVYFYIHRYSIAAASANGFAGQLLEVHALSREFLPTTNVSENGDVINVVLHTIYGRSCVHFNPTFETTEAAIAALIKYGVPIEAQALPPTPLYQLLTSHARYQPIRTYALAGQHQLEDVAVEASGHLLSYDLSTTTDELARKMGPVYFKRLFLLHQSRLMALRDIVLRPPTAHSVKPGSDHGYEHGRMVREWAHATAELVWNATASMSGNTLRAHFEQIGEKITCEWCRLELVERIRDVVGSWSVVKPTI
ncbi:hypothetical protein C8Q80DRAFT_865322 [Daedaleopsis nitida]|nr:hypothetical protein C8Q80DRAFT_865322 [Daedaleopsis nitida]